MSNERHIPGISREGSADFTTILQSYAIVNCWFISAMIGLAHRRPQAIVNMVESFENDSFQVRLPNHGVVSVSVNANGACNHFEGERRTNGFANALESAANAQGWGADTWRALTMGRGIKCLTGNGASLSTNLFFGFGNLFRSFHRKLEAAEGEGKIMVIGTGIKRIRIAGLHPRHCYAILQYDPKEQIAILRDPYGVGTAFPEERAVPEKGPAAFWLTLTELNQNFMGLAIEK